MKAHILVRFKDIVKDSSGEVISEKLRESGFPDVRAVRTGKYYEVEFSSADEAEVRERAEELGKKVLTNKSSEEFIVTAIEE